MYIRFVRPNLVQGTSSREGFFCAAYEMRDDDALDVTTSQQLERHLAWFRTNLAIPDKFNRSNSKGAWRRATKGLSWFKDDATTVIQKSFELTSFLKSNGFPIEIIRTMRVGYITYEDENQIVAEPYADTPT